MTHEMPCDDCGESIPILFARIVGARPVRLVCRTCARRWIEGRRRIGVNALSSVDHDHCDACGKCTVVTDVWIDRTPMTLCQPCVLDALTAEGEQLGQYWEIEP